VIRKVACLIMIRCHNWLLETVQVGLKLIHVYDVLVICLVENRIRRVILFNIREVVENVLENLFLYYCSFGPIGFRLISLYFFILRYCLFGFLSFPLLVAEQRWALVTLWHYIKLESLFVQQYGIHCESPHRCQLLLLITITCQHFLKMTSDFDSFRDRMHRVIIKKVE
jgi:hypothetical protein